MSSDQVVPRLLRVPERQRPHLQGNMDVDDRKIIPCSGPIIASKGVTQQLGKVWAVIDYFSDSFLLSSISCATKSTSTTFVSPHGVSSSVAATANGISVRAFYPTTDASTFHFVRDANLVFALNALLI